MVVAEVFEDGEAVPSPVAGNPATPLSYCDYDDDDVVDYDEYHPEPTPHKTSQTSQGRDSPSSKRPRNAAALEPPQKQARYQPPRPATQRQQPDFKQERDRDRDRDRKTLDLLQPVAEELAVLGRELQEVRKSNGPANVIYDMHQRLRKLESEVKDIRKTQDKIEDDLYQIIKQQKSRPPPPAQQPQYSQPPPQSFMPPMYAAPYGYNPYAPTAYGQPAYGAAPMMPGWNPNPTPGSGATAPNNLNL
jgi:hypothetical protein